jgi:sentrin-specific protease 8
MLLDDADVQSLLEGEELTDGVIVNVLEQQKKKHSLEKELYVFTPATATVLQKATKRSASTQLSDLKLNDYKMLLLPVHNSKNSHWSLVIYVRSQGFFHMDSLEPLNQQIALKIIRNLTDHLDNDYKCIYKKTSPQQDPGVDCGVHLLENAKYAIDHVLLKDRSLTEIIDRPMGMTQEVMNRYREQMLFNALNK